MTGVARRLDQLDHRVHRWLVAHSLTALRLSLGAIFFYFGALKLVPGVSPADFLVQETVFKLTFGIVSGPVGVLLVALLETSIGIAFLANRLMRIAVPLLAFAFVGILSPLLLFPNQLFSGGIAPTLTGQYILKDFILLAGACVVATTLRGGGLRTGRRATRAAVAAQDAQAAAHLRLAASAPADHDRVRESA